MLLLDTCTLIWLDSNPEKISVAAREAIRSNIGQLFVSSISAFEIAVKCRRGKLALPPPAEQWFAAALVAHGVQDLAIDWRTAMASGQLPLLHVASAQLRGMSIATPDPLIAAYPQTKVVW